MATSDVKTQDILAEIDLQLNRRQLKYAQDLITEVHAAYQEEIDNVNNLVKHFTKVAVKEHEMCTIKLKDLFHDVLEPEDATMECEEIVEEFCKVNLSPETFRQTAVIEALTAIGVEDLEESEVDVDLDLSPELTKVLVEVA